MATKKINVTLDGSRTFADEVLRFPGSGAATLLHDFFEDSGLIIRTGAGGAGTLLVKNSDYTLGNEHASLGSRCTAAQSPAVVQVFNTITVTNASYQAVDLYVTGKYVADAVEGEDVTDPSKREQVEAIAGNDLAEGNHLHADAYGELWELATPDCVSSLGRKPTDDSFVHFEPGMVYEDGRPKYANPLCRWPAEAVADPQDCELTADPAGTGRGVVAVFQGTWNATPLPFGMEWGGTSITTGSTSRTFKGHEFRSATSTSASGYIESSLMINSVTAGAENTPWSIVLARGGTDARARITDTGGGGGDRMSVDVNFSTKAVTVNTGTLSHERWYGDDVVELGGWTTTLVSPESRGLRWLIHPSAASTGTLEIMHPTFSYTYDRSFGAPPPWRGRGMGGGFLVYRYPEWQNEGTMELWALPQFGYNATAYHTLVMNSNLSAATSNYLFLRWHANDDRWYFRVVGDDSSGVDYIDVVGPTVVANAALQKWTHFHLTWSKVGNAATMHIDGVAGTATTTGLGISTLDFPADGKWLGLGCNTNDLKYETSDAGGRHTGQAYLSDLRIRQGTVEAPADLNHYARGRPWYRPDRLMGANGVLKIDDRGTFWAAGGTP